MPCRRSSARTENGIYNCTTTTSRRVFFTATDPTNAANTVTVTLRRFGTSAEDLLTNWSHTGEFQQRPARPLTEKGSR